MYALCPFWTVSYSTYFSLSSLRFTPLITICFFSPLSSFTPGDAYYLAIGGGVAEHNWNHIRTTLQDQGFRCHLTDHSEDMGMISIQGPKRWGIKERRREREKRVVNYLGHCHDLYTGEKGQNMGVRAKSREEERRKKEVTDWLMSKDTQVMIHILDTWDGEKLAVWSIRGEQVKWLFLRVCHRHKWWVQLILQLNAAIVCFMML